MEDLLEKLQLHFSSNVFSTVNKLQSIGNDSDQLNPTTSSVTIDEAGERILKCIEGLSKVQVCTATSWLVWHGSDPYQPKGRKRVWGH